MVGKKALRLTASALLVGATLGAQTARGASPHHALANTGVVTITDWQFPDGCNQIASASAVAARVCGGTMLDTLFLLDNKLNYQPDLASRIPSQKNGDVKVVNGNLQVTYRLKPNLKWSDGQPLTMDDIIFSVKVQLAAGSAFGLDQITNMSKVDNSTAVFTYKGIYAPFVAYGNPSGPLLPQHYITKKYGSTDINTIAQKFATDNYNSPDDVFAGAFKIQSWTTNQSIVLAPNPYFTALPPAPGHQRLQQFVFKTISGNESDLATALGSPNAGVDVAENFQANDLPVLQRSRYKIDAVPSLTVEHVELNNAGVLKDVRLRQAVQYAVNKHALFHQLFPTIPDNQINGFLLKTVLPNSSPYADKSAQISEYNPTKAKALLKAAGYDASYNGPGKHLTLIFATTSAPIRQKDVGIITRYLAEVGIHVTQKFTTPYGNGGLFSKYSDNGILLQGRFDLALFAFDEAPDPAQSAVNFDPSLIPTPAKHLGTQNYAHISDQDQANLLLQGAHVLDNGQRRAIYSRWQQLTNQRVYWMMLYARQQISAFNGSFGNWKPNGSSAENEWNAYEYFK